MLTGTISVAVIGVIVALWNYIKTFLLQISGRLIAQIDIDFPFGAAVSVYARKKFKQSRFSPQYFYSSYEFVRPLRKTQLIAGEIYNSKGNLFWNSYFPIWISYEVKDGNLSLIYLRGTLDSDKFLTEALDYFNEIMLESTSDLRFQINYIFGTDGKPAKLNVGSNNDDFEEENSYRMLKHSRLLKWKKDDLGKDITDNGQAVNKLSLCKDAEKLVKDVNNWINNKDWFYNRGIPWKMGATLYGKPGTGKSALIAAIGKDLNLPIFVFSLATLFDDELFREWREMLAQTPCIAVFEDFDTVFNGRKNIAGGHLTLDAVLNVVDGIDRANGIITFLTTNHLENIDPALTRAGRIDRIVEMTELDQDGRLKMANRILDGYNQDIINELVENNKNTTGAEFQLICESKSLDLYNNNNNINKLLECVNV